MYYICNIKIHGSVSSASLLITIPPGPDLGACISDACRGCSSNYIFWSLSTVKKYIFYVLIKWQIAATCHATLLRCKLKSVVGRITTHLKHCHATKFRCSKLKQHVAASWTGVYFFRQIFSTCNKKFCCVTIFEVGGRVIRAFQLAMQQMLRCKLQQFVARITSPLHCKSHLIKTNFVF